MTRPSRPFALSTAPLLFLFSACARDEAPRGPSEEAPRDVVLLVHGMGRGEGSMEPLAESLADAGFEPRLFGYDGVGDPPETSAARLREEFERLGRDPAVPRFHVVGHSLGNILARMALLEGRPESLGRVVMLAPPNQGSRWGRLLGPALGRIVKPLDDLSDAEGSPVRTLPPPDGVEFGVIAARFDGKVSVESTHLAGEADHLVVNGVHTFLMRQGEVQRQVAHFLREGRFAREEE